MDAGHGGHDSGAIGNGYREKDLALAVAKQLYSNLKRDYNVIMTRKDDTFIPLNERAAIGNRANANLFISIHLNASVNKEAHGSEVYYFEKNPSIYARERATAENNFDIAGTRAIESSNFLINDILYGMIQRESSSFANTILKNIVSTMSIQRRKVLGANFAVLRGSKSPSVLVELGFITNENDVRLYTSEEGQRNAANAIANAVRKHY
ncbi:N-acetylmuramoyl-L-alanine amidase [Sneathia sanguinegens]|uniref:N-acetylmuramoyl-L-alanine amidase n=1 Tax=Sneathia sanguinegens TaxID=40543 RepID=A0ABT7HL17_9FUSO|nr:N-acetylmuramoyl-L-alanine amidase [Sneathia sanguinegens]MDK9580877.1 N-acetylmuramoyl-L-alanine amidase [Sneathia sanguinegens]